MPRTFPPALLLAAAAVVLSAGPATAAGPNDAALFGGLGSYWRGFVDFWVGTVQKQNGVVLLALGLGAVGIFIITRGKWGK